MGRSAYFFQICFEFLSVCLLAGCAGQHPRPVGSAATVLPACYVPTADTSGWRTVQVYETEYFLRIPPDFSLDSKARFMHGGVRWRRGEATLDMVVGTCRGPNDVSGNVGWNECTDTLAGAPFRIMSVYYPARRVYMTGAKPILPPPDGTSLGYCTFVAGASPDSSDQQLFLAVLRTLRIDSITPGSK